MQKVSYMGNGTTTEFTFNFPFYEDTNIKVTKNNVTASGYTLVGTSGGVDADIPYTGGKIIFDTAPTSLDSIVISRSLPLTRSVDYQPTAKIEPTTLNQDMNYMLEILKDMQDELDGFRAQYTDITDKESTQTLLAKIDEIDDEISTVSAQITSLGDVSAIGTNIAALQQSVSGLTTTIGGHATSIGALDTRTTGIIDYVIQSQLPTAQNNYTWYRKYKSGWVEQGGVSTSHEITFPIEMADTNYMVICGMKIPSSNTGNPTITYETKTTTGMLVLLRWDGTGTNGERCWQVSGISAA